MHHLSINISLPLYEELKENALANEMSVSDVARECLSIGLKKFKLNSVDHTDSKKIQESLNAITLSSYCLIEQLVKHIAPNSNNILNLAQKEAQHLAISLFKVE